MSSPAIDIINLTHYYNSHPAVDNISFQVPLGTILGLLGPMEPAKALPSRC